MTRKSYDVVEFPELPSIMYLTGVSTEMTRRSRRPELGYLVTPASDPNGLQIRHYEYYGADNGNYALKGKPFDAERWLAWLDRLDPTRCLFVALPDVLHWHVDPKTGKEVPVGDAKATLKLSAKYVDTVKAKGFPVALVAQDGLTSLDEVPFEIDAVFIGGSNEYKLGEDVRRIVREARERGLWVHMGRVNSGKRLRYASEIGADSADGTFLKYGRKADQPAQFRRMMSWFDIAGHKPTVEELAAA